MTVIWSVQTITAERPPLRQFTTVVHVRPRVVARLYEVRKTILGGSQSSSHVKKKKCIELFENSDRAINCNTLYVIFKIVLLHLIDFFLVRLAILRYLLKLK